jgi:acid stress-induced BolA-like protein IbaG/YrbA
MAKLRTLSQERLKTILSSKLSLKDPQFLLEKIDGRLLGNIISPTFKGKKEHVRQGLIWDALEEEIGPDFARLVGLLLPYTPDEWNIGTIAAPSSKPRRAS